jgi:hypothetical protein
VIAIVGAVAQEGGGLGLVKFEVGLEEGTGCRGVEVASVGFEAEKFDVVLGGEVTVTVFDDVFEMGVLGGGGWGVVAPGRSRRTGKAGGNSIPKRDLPAGSRMVDQMTPCLPALMVSPAALVTLLVW